CSTSVATGVIPNGGQNQLGEGIDAEQIERIAVQPDDIVLLTVQPRTTFECDATLVDLQISELEGKKRSWNLLDDVLPDFAQGKNPHPDRFGNTSVWHFCEMSDQPFIDTQKNSALAKWFDCLNRKAGA